MPGLINVRVVTSAAVYACAVQFSAPRMAEEELISFIRGGDVKGIAALLEKGSSPIQADTAGNTPLDIADASQNKAIIDILVQKIVKTKSEAGNAALNHAVVRNQPAVVESLLKHGVDPNTYNKDGAAPLHIAAKLGKMPIVKMLIKYGADPQIFHQLSQATPAQLAGPHGHFEIEMYLAQLTFKAGGGKETRGTETLMAIALAALALAAVVLVPQARRAKRKV
eukprot:jgi/Botrbrau1/8982/Bobra.0148s0088.1